jgi:hypothetical protein
MHGMDIADCTEGGAHTRVWGGPKTGDVVEGQINMPLLLLKQVDAITL